MRAVASRPSTATSTPGRTAPRAAAHRHRARLVTARPPPAPGRGSSARCTPGRPTGRSASGPPGREVLGKLVLDTVNPCLGPSAAARARRIASLLASPHCVGGVVGNPSRSPAAAAASTPRRRPRPPCRATTLVERDEHIGRGLRFASGTTTARSRGPSMSTGISSKPTTTSTPSRCAASMKSRAR